MNFTSDPETTEEKLKRVELENLHLKRTLLELQFKLLPYQHKEICLEIEELEKAKDSNNSKIEQ